MSNYRWGSGLYQTGVAAAFACCTEWLCGQETLSEVVNAKQAVLNHLRSFDAEAFAADCIEAWRLDTPGGRDPSPDDSATSLLADWGNPSMGDAMAQAMAALLRHVADDIENDA